MSHDEASRLSVSDFEPANATFLSDVVAGLSKPQKQLPCKYFYDRAGSQLFDQICELDEYYLTRAELEIMSRFAPEMAEQIGPGVMLIEYGSGSSIKTRLLLDALVEPTAYVPVDISRKHLQHSAEALAELYTEIEVLPVCADFTTDFELPTAGGEVTHNAVYFPGSTIGNFQPNEVVALLRRITQLGGVGGGLLIGIDLKKDVERIEAAYNDRDGVTAEFNLNLLRRINRDLDADFQLEQFEHAAVYNPDDGRVEMRLVSCTDQSVSIGDQRFDFSADEYICTEYSHKYTIDEFAGIAANVGLTLRRQWIDPQGDFAVLHFAVLEADS